MKSIHLKYMQRAIDLATKGTRSAYPNPSVGAVIVFDDKIIGEGYTDVYGGPHAEVNAINSVKNKELLSKATLYVTMEPCSHYGKTPPCANLIINHNIPRIYIGCIDTFSEVSGRGVEILQKANKEVYVGVLEEECLNLHKRFLNFCNKQKPYVVLKWAETKDGFIDIDRKVTSIDDAKPTWISNELSRQKVHQIRAVEHAIMVGTNTALKDNPTLTTRTYGGENPVRILIDRNLKVPENYNLYDGSVKTIVFTEKQSSNNKVVFKQIDFSRDVVSQVLNELYIEKIQSVLVEGGKQLLTSFIDAGLWDEANVFVGNSTFKSGVTAPSISKNPAKESVIGNNVLKLYTLS